MKLSTATVYAWSDSYPEYADRLRHMAMNVQVDMLHMLSEVHTMTLIPMVQA